MLGFIGSALAISARICERGRCMAAVLIDIDAAIRSSIEAGLKGYCIKLWADLDDGWANKPRHFATRKRGADGAWRE